MLAPAETIPTVSEIEELLALNPGLIGVSTGYMVGARGDWPRLAAAAEVLSDDVVELSALSARELPGLVSFLEDVPELPFRHVSVHGPPRAGVRGRRARPPAARAAAVRRGGRDAPRCNGDTYSVDHGATALAVPDDSTKAA